MIFLSKDGVDPYINMLASSSNTTPISTDNFNYASSNDTVFLRGILKHKLMKQCIQDGRDFYYMDTGYFGNDQSLVNPRMFKLWHRIVKNNLQHHEIQDRPSDRFEKLNVKFQPWKKTGRNILLALPDEKPCKFYNIDRDAWITNTVKTIKKHTDRPIVLRERTPDRTQRMINEPLKKVLQDGDIFALVTFNSLAAIEAILTGIPVFTLSPIHSAQSVGLSDLSKIETPYYPECCQLYKWAKYLAYGQFHTNELKDGTALKIIKKYD